MSSGVNNFKEANAHRARPVTHLQEHHRMTDVAPLEICGSINGANSERVGSIAGATLEHQPRGGRLCEISALNIHPL